MRITTMSNSNSDYLKTPPDWRFNAAANLYTNDAGETRPNIYGNPRKVKYPTPRGNAGEGTGWEKNMNLDAHSSGHQFDIGAAPVVDNEVVRPAHYTRGAVECIDAIEAALTPEEYRGYLKGNVLKYFWRERDKGGLQSIQKAEYYTQRLIKLLGASK